MRATLGILCTLLLTLPSTAVGQDVSAAIEEGAQAWEEAYNAGDAAKVASQYATDAILYPPEAEPIQGREAIQAFWQEAMDTKEFAGSTNEIEVDEVHVLNDAVVAEGSYVTTGPDGGHVDHGSFLNVMEQVDGEWKLFRHIWNSNMSP